MSEVNIYRTEARVMLFGDEAERLKNVTALLKISSGRRDDLQLIIEDIQRKVNDEDLDKEDYQKILEQLSKDLYNIAWTKDYNKD